MGISSVASYLGGQLFEVLELDADVVARCFPAAAAWPGRSTFADLAGRQLRRAAASAASRHRHPASSASRPRVRPVPRRRRAHLYAPTIVAVITALATEGTPGDVDAALARYREALARGPADRAVPRDQLARPTAVAPTALLEVEDARSIVRRFVGSAMSLGALSPEAHQALTHRHARAGRRRQLRRGRRGSRLVRRRVRDGDRRDAAIKQVASARFGVTAEYLARAEQLEIKIAQGSKPGEGGQLPGKKVTRAHRARCVAASRA